MDDNKYRTIILNPSIKCLLLNEDRVTTVKKRFTQPLWHEQDATHAQVVSGVKLVWIQFTFPRLVVKQTQKEPVCPTSLAEREQINSCLSRWR